MERGEPVISVLSGSLHAIKCCCRLVCITIFFFLLIVVFGVHYLYLYSPYYCGRCCILFSSFSYRASLTCRVLLLLAKLLFVSLFFLWHKTHHLNNTCHKKYHLVKHPLVKLLQSLRENLQGSEVLNLWGVKRRFLWSTPEGFEISTVPESEILSFVCGLMANLWIVDEMSSGS